MIACLFLAGCIQRTPTGEEGLSVAIPPSYGGNQAIDGDTGDAWLQSFGDERLEQLVAEAMGGNLELAGAVARVDQALAIARIEGADRWPILNLNGSGQRQVSRNLEDGSNRTHSNRFDLGFVARWEFDLWGRARSQAKAGSAAAAAVTFDYAALRLSLAAQVAQAWFDVLEATEQETLAQETLNSFEENLRIFEERFRSGITPALDVRLTRANVANARATHRQQARLLDVAVRRLEVLIGRYPSGKLAVETRLPHLSTPVPEGLPAELLNRRPDILAAEQRLWAADARVAESRRSLLPGINLTARYGQASEELEDILKDNFDIWSLVGEATAPIFQGGRLRANVKRNKAIQAEVLARYRQVALEAFREVETALVSEVLLREQWMAVKLSAEESVAAQALAEERYGRGLVDIITVLESQRRAFDARRTLLAVQNALLQNRLALYLALGGNFKEHSTLKRLKNEGR